MNPLDKVLNKFNKKFEDLNLEELEFYQNAQKALNQRPPTISEQVESLNDLIENLCIKLCDIRTEDKTDTYIKAKLSNAMMLRASLQVGEKAKKYFEKLAERT